MTTAQLLTRIRADLRRRRLDALLVTQPENRLYLSGYTARDTSLAESAGVLLIPAAGPPFLFTDSRYHLQALAEAAGFEVMLYPRGLLVLLEKLLPRLGIRRLAFESHAILHATALALMKTAAGVEVEAVPLTGLVERLRVEKSEEELVAIRKAVRLNEEVFRAVFATLRPGLREREVALHLETLMRQKGAGRPSFDTMVASGPNGALPHAVPSDRELREGEPIVIDMGLVLDGYCSDMTRTVVLGEPDAKTVELFRIVRRAQLAGMERVRAGVAAREVDRAARQVIAAAGYGDYFGHGLGHGVGLAVHEAPSLNRRNRKHLRAGMVVTVEPGIYLPEWGGIRLENMVAVTAGGCELLNTDVTFLDL
ncbi:MAG: aminopeptidase P family protein [Desulfobacteraceae bacterium]|nr:aminopeptidase P family protein [Desulfobacteraceae bacterium]